MDRRSTAHGSSSCSIETADRYERSGRTGRAAYWEIDRQRLAQRAAGLVRPRLAARRRTRAPGDRLRAALRDRRRRHARPARTGDSSPSTAASTASTARRTGLVVTDHKVGSPTIVHARSTTPIRRRAAPGSSCRPMPPRPACSAAEPDRLPGLEPVRAEYSFFARGKLPAHRLRVRRRRVGHRSAATCSTSSRASRPAGSRRRRSSRSTSSASTASTANPTRSAPPSATPNGSASGSIRASRQWFAGRRDRASTTPAQRLATHGARSLASVSVDQCTTARPGRSQPHPRRARQQPVRRGRGRRRQDVESRRPHRRARPLGCRDRVDRRDHLHREGRRPSCATGCGSALRRLPPTRRPTCSTASASTPRSTSSITPRSARCTPSPDGCSTNSRSPPGCRPASACSTSSRATSPSRNAGRTCSSVCSSSRIPSGGALDGGVELVQLCDFDEFGLHKTFRRVAVGFHENWDLVEARVDTLAATDLGTVDTEPLRALVDAATGVAHACPTTPRPTCVAELGGWSATAAVGDDDDRAARPCVAIAKRFAKPRAASATRTNWQGLRQATPRSPSCATANSRSATRRAGSSSRHARTAVRLVGAILGRWVLESADAASSRRHGRVPRPARAAPAGWCRPSPTSAPRSTVATSACCSTSSRTPIRSSSRSPFGSRPLPTTRRRQRDWSDARATSRPAVHRRRPEAVDLPVPARRHRPVPARRRAGRRRPRHAERQLPFVRAR